MLEKEWQIGKEREKEKKKSSWIPLFVLLISDYILARDKYIEKSILIHLDHSTYDMMDHTSMLCSCCARGRYFRTSATPWLPSWKPTWSKWIFLSWKCYLLFRCIWKLLDKVKFSEILLVGAFPTFSSLRVVLCDPWQ